MDDSDGHIDVALHAAGKVFNGLFAPVVKTDELPNFTGVCFAFFGRNPIELAEELQVFQRGQVFVQGNLLGHNSQHFFDPERFLRHRAAVDHRIAGGRGQIAAHHTDRGNFAGAMGSQLLENFALADGEGDAFRRFVFAKAFQQVDDLNRRASIGWQMDRAAARWERFVHIAELLVI